MAKLATVVSDESTAAPQATRTSTPPRPRGGQALLSAMVLAGYLFLGLLAFWPSLLQIRERAFSIDGDFTLSTWMLGWVAHALAHGQNPFFSNAMFVPTGVNLAQNTQGPLLGLAATPITLTLGPTVTANVLMVLAMPISAAAAFIVFKQWRVWAPAAALGGLAYGFSPYMIGQALGHPVLFFLPLPPFIVSTLFSILLRRGSDRGLGIQLGLLAAAQFLISPEIFASLALMVGIGLVFVILRNPHRAVQMAPVVLRPIGIALAVCIVLLAYPLWMLLAGPQHVSGPTYPLQNGFHNDLWSFVVPGELQRVTLGPLRPTNILPGWVIFDPMEAGGYVGLPVLIAAGLLGWRSRHSARMQLWMALLLSSALLSLGPFLYDRGLTTNLPLPFWIVGHLPLVANLLPIRISFEVSACIAAILAFGLDDLRQAPGRKRSRSQAVIAVIATCFVLALLVVTQLPRWPYGSTPVERLPTSLSRMIPAGDPVAITFPFADGHAYTSPLLWQAEASYSFRLLGGYAFHPDQRGQGTTMANALDPNGLQNYLILKEWFQPHLPVTSDLVVTARTTISRYHIQLIIVDRAQSGAMGVIDLFRRVLGTQPVSSGKFTMWVVHQTRGVST